MEGTPVSIFIARHAVNEGLVLAKLVLEKKNEHLELAVVGRATNDATKAA